MVAAWIRALTGVGPSMASGSQTCRGNCADLPMAPQRSSSGASQRKVCALKSPCTASDPSATAWYAAKTSVNLKDCATETSSSTPSMKPTSPNRVTTKAFLAALAAEGLNHQNPMSR